MRNNIRLAIVPSQRSVLLPVFTLVLISGTAAGAEAGVKEVRTQKNGETVYFEAMLETPGDLRMPKRQAENPPPEIMRRTLAGLPRLVPLDRAAAAVYFLSPQTGQGTDGTRLIFMGKVCGKGPARLRLLYPTGTASATIKGSLLEPYLRAPAWGEAMVTLDFSKARPLDPPGMRRSANRPPSSVDLAGRWAQAQEHELSVWETHRLRIFVRRLHSPAAESGQQDQGAAAFAGTGEPHTGESRRAVPCLGDGPAARQPERAAGTVRARQRGTVRSGGRSSVLECGATGRRLEAVWYA